MKKIVIGLLAMAFTASAVLTSIFNGYDSIKDRSPDIFVARCITNPPAMLHFGNDPGVNAFSIAIVATIKGTNHSGYVSLVSEQWLNQGDNYLIFGKCENGTCRAIEDFRVIPLGRELSSGMFINDIAGKPQDDQLQILFKRSLDGLDRQMKKEQEQKERLQSFLKK